MNLNAVRDLFAKAGCNRLYAKLLAENDNSKNQIYLGHDFKSLNLLPILDIRGGDDPNRNIMKASLSFSWLGSDGRIEPAPRAQLILYPSYPEVRFSGFLAGCKHAPSEILTIRTRHRVLFMGITPDRRILGHAASSGSIVSNQLLSMTRSGTKGIFIEIPMCASPEIDDDRACLIRSLKHIHEKGWIDSKQLSGDGTLTPCNAPQCGGFTLEAELGISKNSLSEPDYHGWEIKQHHVSSFERLEVGIITLMTPEPDGGQYANEGPEQFVRKFGYPDKNGRADRHNFGGLYRVGVRNPSTRLTLNLIGYQPGEE